MVHMFINVNKNEFLHWKIKNIIILKNDKNNNYISTFNT
jgi:hypothetical protein